MFPILGTSEGRRVLVEKVDLFERQAFRLRNTEVSEDDATRTRRAPDEENLDAEAGISWSRVD